MIEFSTLTQALQVNASLDREITYIQGHGEERAVSFAELRDRALSILRVLQDQGITPGDQLIIFLNSNEQFIDAFWACLVGGIIPVPVAVGISDEHRHKLLRIFQKLARPHLYTDSKTLSRLRCFALSNDLNALLEKVMAKTVLVDQIDAVGAPGAEHPVKPDDIAFIQFSSGSTSEPKGVVLTHRNILTNINAIIEGAQFTDRDVSLSWMPLTHDMGLIGFHLNMFVCGIKQYLMPTDLFVRRPLLWLLETSQKHVNITCSPNFGYKHVLKVFDDKKLQGVNLSHVRLIFNGAEPISARLCNEFLDRLARYGLNRTAMFTVYGLAEASLAVSFPPCEREFKTLYVDRDALKLGDQVKYLGPHDQQAISFVSVGYPVRDCQVRLSNEKHLVAAENIVGRILIKGDNVTGGYLNNDQANRTAFDNEGWLDTGDLGFMADGELVITGRAKDIIFVNGQNYFPHDLESLALQVEGLELGKIVICGTRPVDADVDDLLAFILFRGKLVDFLETATQVRQIVNERTGLEITHLIPVKRIPKTTSGKIQRHLLEEQYRHGEFQQLLQELQQLREINREKNHEERSEIESKLKQICDAAVPEKHVDVDDNLFEIGTSSLALVEIHEGIEQAFPGAVELSDLLEHPTIAELAVFLEEKTTPA